MSSRAKARNKRLGINARRKGQTAACGGHPSRPFPTFQRLDAKSRTPKRESFNEPLTIAEAWGNQAPAGEMTQKRLLCVKWGERKERQRARARERAEKKLQQSA